MNITDTIVAATTNKGKIAEIKEIMECFGFHVISRDEAGIPKDFVIEETGNTFEENSFIKAKTVMELTGLSSIADDSGLCVDALDGAPGVYSSRFSGDEGNDEANNKKLIELMKDVEDEKRTARFVSVITLIEPSGETISAKGYIEGKILRKSAGNNGFGYDPLFVPNGFEKSFGQLGFSVKNTLSHRAKALDSLRKILKEKGLNER